MSLSLTLSLRDKNMFLSVCPSVENMKICIYVYVYNYARI
nr:MAG TPA: hypothetical protein [Caudoviricetes sp.]DAL91993.1 MAG TPA: hypothetical protein [Caudoviricetes sp.]